MTVAELIQELLQLDQSLQVCTMDNEDGETWAAGTDIRTMCWGRVDGPAAGDTVVVIL